MMRSVVAKVSEIFTERALKSANGKTVPLRAYPGGPIIGEATMQYNPKTQALEADMTIEDSTAKELLMGPMPYSGLSINHKKES